MQKEKKRWVNQTHSITGTKQHWTHSYDGESYSFQSTLGGEAHAFKEFDMMTGVGKKTMQTPGSRTLYEECRFSQVWSFYFAGGGEWTKSLEQGWITLDKRGEADPTATRSRDLWPS